jgi:hypothetical protein
MGGGGGGGLWIQWFRDWRNHSLKTGHYMRYIISGVGHPRSDSVVPLMLWTVMYNGRGTNAVLQVPQDNTNPAGNG